MNIKNKNLNNNNQKMADKPGFRQDSWYASGRVGDRCVVAVQPGEQTGPLEKIPSRSHK